MEYCQRSKAAGFKNYYVPDKFAMPISDSSKDKQVYGYKKAQHLAKTMKDYTKAAIYTVTIYRPFGIDLSMADY